MCDFRKFLAVSVFFPVETKSAVKAKIWFFDFFFTGRNSCPRPLSLFSCPPFKFHGHFYKVFTGGRFLVLVPEIAFLAFGRENFVKIYIFQNFPW